MTTHIKRKIIYNLQDDSFSLTPLLLQWCDSWKPAPGGRQGPNLHMSRDYNSSSAQSKEEKQKTKEITSCSVNLCCLCRVGSVTLICWQIDVGVDFICPIRIRIRN